LIEAGRPAEGEPIARTALAAFGDQPAPDDEVAVRSAIAAASLAQGRTADAAGEVERTAGPLAACNNRTVRLQAAVTAARVHAAVGQRRDAEAELRAAAGEAQKLGLLPLALEARLALAELERSTAPAAARDHLAAIAREASAAGLVSLARRALTPGR